MNMGDKLTAAHAEEVGMDPERLNAADQVVKKALTEGIFPGAVLLVARRGKIVKHTSYGLAMERPQRRAMTTSTVFDLASLTKVVITVPLALVLVEKGLWSLKEPLARFLPKGKFPEVTLWNLLTHTSGLPAWANLFVRGQGQEAIEEELFTDRWPVTALVSRPGERVLYSDLGYILLGKAIEVVSGAKLDALAREHLLTPLGMKDTGFNPPLGLEDRFAATEDDPGRGMLVSVVHDENARAMGGVAGHAGLFSTASDLALYAQMLLNQGCYDGVQVLSAPSVALMTRPHTEKLNEQRALGWLVQAPSTQGSGDLLSARAFGHHGFTGTSLWVDPLYQMSVIFLTNRVHPSRRRGAEEINSVRSRVCNAVAGAITRE